MHRLSLFAAALLALPLAAQMREPDLVRQRAEMKKLEFLVGEWSGPASVLRNPRQPVQLTQHESVQYKLGGLVLLVEGTGRNAEGQVVFNAMATISWDEAAGVYKFRSHSEGRYLETDLRLIEGPGFEWGFTAGPAQVLNRMKLTPEGAWAETTEVTIGNAPARKTLEMTVRKVK